MRNLIIQYLTDALQPTYLNLSDESSKHAGHNEAAKGGGTHFDLKIVSAKFAGKNRVERHRMIYKILDAQLKSQVHALAITALSPEEFKH